jgi:hypothetical protein
MGFIDGSGDADREEGPSPSTFRAAAVFLGFVASGGAALGLRRAAGHIDAFFITGFGLNLEER